MERPLEVRGLELQEPEAGELEVASVVRRVAAQAGEPAAERRSAGWCARAL